MAVDRDSKQQPAGRPASKPAHGSPPGAQLIVLAGADAGRRFIIKDRATIGRADTTILLFDDEISRRHAEIEWGGPRGYLIRDLGSRNGTFVNEEPVEHCQLNYGDELRIGAVQLAFRRHDPLEEELLSRQRLETLGRLGAGVAHDINNVIGAVLGNVEYLRSLLHDRGHLDEAALECIQDVLDSLQRASSLTPRLLRIARHEERRHSRVDLSELAGEVVKLMRRTFDRSIEIRQHIRPQLYVMGDTVALHQVIMNLCLNARDAMLPDGGVLTLAVTSAPPNELGNGEPLADRPGIVISVADTGRGMDEHTESRVFERFFTTKGKGAGYGIGLSTTRDLVTEHGGRIVVQSELGAGSTFRVWLPGAPPERTTRRMQITPQLVPEVLGGVRSLRGRVMVVDDEDMIHRMLSRTLRKAGYEVMSVREGSQAVEQYRSNNPKPDLVLLDIDMPKFSGEAVQRALRAADPGVRIVVLTGHADVGRERTLLAEGALGVLHKPVHVESLLAEITRVMRSTPFDDVDVAAEETIDTN